MLPIQQKLTTSNYTHMTNKQNKFIVIHYVGSVSSAKNNVDYFYSGNKNASANYFVDETSIWQCVKDTDRAWHCGGGLQGSGGRSFYKICTNSNSIGIEMCCKKNSAGQWYFEEATIQNTIELTQYLMKKWNINLDHVIRHYDVTGKVCPEPYVRNQTNWQNFKNRLVGKYIPPQNNNQEVIKKEEDIVTQEQFNTMMNIWIADSASRPASDWSADSRVWAEGLGLIAGDQNGNKMYKKFITREEFVTVLYRVLTDKKFAKVMEDYISVVSKEAPSDWSQDARLWAENNKIVVGDGESKAYKKFVTKEEVVAMLMRSKGVK